MTEEKTDEKEKDSTEEKLERIEEATQKLEEANEKVQQNMLKLKELEVERTLAGKADAGLEQSKEETDVEYMQRVMSGKL